MFVKRVKLYQIFIFLLLFNPALPSSAYSCWKEVVDFDPCNSPISGDTNVQFDPAIGLYVGYLENSEWKAKVGFSGGSVNEPNNPEASCESAIAKNPALVCSPGNQFFYSANGDSFFPSCEENIGEQWWGGYWKVQESSCFPEASCRHLSTILYTAPGGSISQILNNHWQSQSQQVVQLWKWLPNCDQCPNDPDKTEPGICGCKTPDTDSDGDGTPDCVDDNKNAGSKPPSC